MHPSCGFGPVYPSSWAANLGVHQLGFRCVLGLLIQCSHSRGCGGHSCCGEFSKQLMSASIFSFSFREIPPNKPPWSKQAPGLSHSPACLSPKNLAADPAARPGASAALVPALVPGTLLSLNTLLLPSDLSMSSTMFGLQSSYMLEYRWLFALFLRSARHFT